MKSTSEKSPSVSDKMSPKNILIVEDEKFAAINIKYMLERLGYKIIGITSSGKEAIRKVKISSPDLVLMDILLKGKMDGVEAAKQIRTQFNIPVIYVTAYEDDIILQRAKVAEPYGYIIKPFTERELRTTIEMAFYKHKMGRKLRESEKRFRQFFENVPEYCYMISQDVITNVNKASIKTLGYKSEELIGRPIQNIYDPENQPKMKRIFEKWEKTGHLEDEELVIITKQGEKRTVLLSADVVRDEKGKILYSLAIQKDITERKRAEDALQKTHDELESKVEERTLELRLLHEEKSQFVSRASHDLRTPVAASLGFIKWLIQGKWGNLNKEQLERLKKVQRHVEKLSRIVSDLLSVSRIEAGVIGAAKDVVNISGEIKEVIAEMADSINLKLQSIEFVDTISPTKIIGDRNSIHQILINLIDNSSVYTDKNGKIIVIVKQNNSKCIVQVKDTGIGLTKEDQKKVFDEFYRVAPKEKIQSQGTGLGLAIVKKLVTQMDGEVWVESEGLDKGSIFSFSIPISSK